MFKQIQQLRFDKRLISFYLKNDLLTQAEVDKHLSELKDCEATSQRLEIQRTRLASDVTASAPSHNDQLNGGSY